MMQHFVFPHVIDQIKFLSVEDIKRDISPNKGGYQCLSMGVPYWPF